MLHPADLAARQFHRFTPIGHYLQCQVLAALLNIQPPSFQVATFMHNTIKVFWSSGRPLLCFSRFWPSENVARIRRVYFAYSRTKSVHTRNIATTSKQTQRVSAYFVLIAPNDRITSYIAGHWRPGQNFMMFQRTKNETWFSKNGNIIKTLVQKTKMGK